MPAEIDVCKALTTATGRTHVDEDVIGRRNESTGSVIVVTRFGNKARITPSGECEILTGPGAAPDLYEAPEVAVEEPTLELPPLEDEPQDSPEPLKALEQPVEAAEPAESGDEVEAAPEPKAKRTRAAKE